MRTHPRLERAGHLHEGDATAVVLLVQAVKRGPEVAFDGAGNIRQPRL